LNQAGIGVDVVSGGGTGAVSTAHEIPELTELRVGTYVFNDWTTVSNGWAKLEDCALKVIATVVSRPSTNRAILDCGSKTLAADKAGNLHGHILEYPQAKIYQLNEEHAYVDLSECEQHPIIGEHVHVIPAHVCAAVNLHDRLYGIRQNEIEVVWQVAARGKVW
ncbi:MAG TPA: hypothetical protein VHL11_06480, partial [Phototrophicaceae bacterium]|nr:hypothetical protein [Phototrophicaceae bacterium]